MASSEDFQSIYEFYKHKNVIIMLSLKQEITVITKYRSAITGIAILWIFLLHSGPCGIPFYDSVISFGWMGVDVFFFLSAFGLSYSLKKCQSQLEFYKRRIIRIIPTWLLVLFLMHVLGVVVTMVMPKLPFHYPHDCIQAFLWYTGIGYWINGFLENPLCCYYEWYIPTLLLFYLIAPFIYKKTTSKLYVLLILSTVISFLFSYFGFLYSLHLSYQRIPVFILGFVVYRMVSGEVNKKQCVCFLSIMSILGFLFVLLSILFDGIYVKYVPLFFMFQVLIILGQIMKVKKINQLFSFLGIISLEIYLLHLFRRPNFLISLLLQIDGILCIIITFILCVSIAFLFHKLCNNINKGIDRYLK